jgi:hypothetical protein
MSGNFETMDFLVIFQAVKEFKARLGKERSRQET